MNLSDVIVMTLCIAVMFYWVGISGWKKDSTDSDKERSGMAILVDHKTGIQYLTTLTGGLTPRMKANGDFMTVEDDQ